MGTEHEMVTLKADFVWLVFLPCERALLLYIVFYPQKQFKTPQDFLDVHEVLSDLCEGGLRKGLKDPGIDGRTQ